MTEAGPILLYNALLFDPETCSRQRGWLRMREGRITELGSSTPESNQGETACDCGGGFLMPGFFDAHTHFVMGGEFLGQLDVSGSSGREELLETLRDHASRVAASPDRRSGWLLGFGLAPGTRLPDLAQLDAATGDVPLRIETHDLHSCLCNSAALGLAGVDRDTADPEGGEILRDTRGNPTGFLRENAAYLMRPAVPRPDHNERRAFLLAAQRHAHALGVTGVGENLRRADVAVIQELEAAGELGMRIQGWRNDGNLVADTLDLPKLDSARFKVDTVKLFADGALGSRSAAMIHPFAGGGHGGLVADVPEMRTWMRHALERDWRIAVHAIGDAGVRQVLDLFEELKAEGFPVTGWRHRIEHLQFVRGEDLQRFRELEILASIQPLHCGTDQDHFDGLVTRRQIEGAYPWQSLLKAGIRMPIGTDWPVEGLDPRQNLVDGSTRLSRKGRGLLDQAEKLSIDQLLAGMTRESARAAGFSEAGQLKPGCLADLVLLEQDPADLLPLELLGNPVLATWSGGRLVYGV